MPLLSASAFAPLSHALPLSLAAFIMATAYSLALTGFVNLASFVSASLPDRAMSSMSWMRWRSSLVALFAAASSISLTSAG